MATILPVEGKSPQFGAACFVAPNATVVGDVIMGDNCSVWFNTVIRGDVNTITIGEESNEQGCLRQGAVVTGAIRPSEDEHEKIVCLRKVGS